MDILEIPLAGRLPLEAELPTPASARLLGTTWESGRYRLDGKRLGAPNGPRRDLFRLGGLVVVGQAPLLLSARCSGQPWTQLPVEAEDAGPLAQALAAHETLEPGLAALGVATLLGHSLIETERQVRRICGLDDADAVGEPAGPAVAERWRAPYFDGDELVFLSAAPLEPPGTPLERALAPVDTVVEVRAQLREGWVELERVGPAWRARVLPPPPNIFPDPEPLVNRMPDVTWNPVPDPEPRTFNPVADPGPRPVEPRPVAPRPGLLDRLRGLFGRGQDEDDDEG